MPQDVTKNASDVENYSKEFLELQKQLSQIYREKFNDVELSVASDSEQELPPDRPALYKGSGTDENYDEPTTFSRRVYTHDSGQAENGNVSIGVSNFEDIFKLGKLDTRYQTTFSGSLGNLSNANNLNVTNYSTSSSSAMRDVFTNDGFLMSFLSLWGSLYQSLKELPMLAEMAEQSRLLMVEELLASNMTNLEAAQGLSWMRTLPWIYPICPT